MGRLDGQVAIVTGGGSGIGRETARLLAAEGAHVVVAGRRKPPLNDVVGEIQKAGGKATARQADVSRHVEAGELAHWTLATLGRVDVLVNNAGHSSRARSIRWVDKDEWDGVLDVNLNGVYALTQAVLPSMIERGGGTIVTVSSVAALRPGLIGGAPYGAAKAAVRNLMGHVHTVLRDKGIRATTVMPAEVDTPILENRPFPPDATASAPQGAGWPRGVRARTTSTGAPRTSACPRAPARPRSPRSRRRTSRCPVSMSARTRSRPTAGRRSSWSLTRPGEGAVSTCPCGRRSRRSCGASASPSSPWRSIGAPRTPAPGSRPPSRRTRP